MWRRLASFHMASIRKLIALGIVCKLVGIYSVCLVRVPLIDDRTVGIQIVNNSAVLVIIIEFHA